MTSNTVGALSSATLGVQRAINAFDLSARRTVEISAELRDGDLATETVKQIESKHALTANAATVKTYDEMMGELVRLGDHRRSSI